MSGDESTDPWLTRWQLHMSCRMCGTLFSLGPKGVSVSLERVSGFRRVVVLMGVPEVCPECRSLQVVSKEEEKS